MKIGINDFVRRQTPASEFSHFAGCRGLPEGSFDELEKLVEQNFKNAEEGYKPGVLLVPVPVAGFFTSFVEVKDDTELVADITRRREGEESFIRVRAKGDKSPAVAVKIVLYSHAVLAENSEQTGEADFEIISINATPTEAEIPMDPVTMARNFMHQEGGTSGNFSPEEFAETIWAHQNWVQVYTE